MQKKYRDESRTWYVKTGEFRAPRANEFYLSGAIPQVYKAYANFTTAPYHIMRPVDTPPREITHDGFTYILKG